MALVSEKTIGNLVIVQCDADPSVDGIDAPIGSLAIELGLPSLWQKTGLNITDWTHILVGAAAPVSVGSANAEGSLYTAARSDHIHQGITSIKQNAGTAQYGAITFLNGSNVTITDNGSGSFTISASSSTLSNELLVSLNTGLNVLFNSGSSLINGAFYAVPSGNLNLPPNITNGWIYVNGSGTVTSTTSSTPPPNMTLLAQFTTNGSSVTSLTDKRSDLNNNVVFGVVADVQGLDAVKSMAAGTVNTYARIDHVHTLASGVVSTQIPDQTNQTGTSSNLARADHIHNIPCAVVVTQNPDLTNAKGSATTFALSDHVHNLPAAVAVSVGIANAKGASTSFSLADHVHQGVHALRANAGTYRYGDLSLLNGTNITITDNGDSTFTIASTFSISYGTPVALAPDTGNIAGSLSTVSRSDHQHNVPTGVVSTQTPDQTNTQGTAVTFCRSDHAHNIPTAVPVSIGTANAQGAAASFARSNHVHQGLHQVKANAGGTAWFGDLILAGGTFVSITDNTTGTFTFDVSVGTPVSQTPDQTNAPGSATTLNRSDHVHNIATAAAVTQNPDLTNARGSATTFARSDHIHNIPCAVCVSVGTANAKGSSTSFALADHVHQGIHSLKVGAGGTARYGDIVLLAGTLISITDDGAGNFTVASTMAYGSPVTIGTSNIDGTATSVPRSDHVHSHGTQTDGTLHAVVTTTVNGFMSATDKIKLNSIKSGSVAGASFAGSPKKATVTFGAAYSSTSYAIVITGADARTYTWESQTVNGFVINANANAAFTGTVYWQTVQLGST